MDVKVTKKSEIYIYKYGRSIKTQQNNLDG